MKRLKKLRIHQPYILGLIFCLNIEEQFSKPILSFSLKGRITLKSLEF